jgi:hypothetical protein
VRGGAIHRAYSTMARSATPKGLVLV